VSPVLNGTPHSGGGGGAPPPGPPPPGPPPPHPARPARRPPPPPPGAGPTVLLWCFWQDTGKVVRAAEEAVGEWAEVRRVPFTPLGADVAEL
jgi:hypothetical protein